MFRHISNLDVLDDTVMSKTHSVSSPRRILSLSKRRTKVAFVDSDDRSSRACVSQDQSPKPSEVYGFVGSITTIVATVIFLIWAYLPESWLHYLGVYYYPSKYWVLAVPAFAIMTIISALGFYLGLNFMQTPPPASFNTIFDEYSREPSVYEASTDGEEQPIDPMYDIDIHKVNRLMFTDSEQHS
ncbi:unnamed protein product [Rhodiola kirilowii]